MRLSWPNYTLGGGPNWYLDGEDESLSNILNNIVIDIPRTDYTKNASNFMQPKLFNFGGWLIGDNPKDFRDRKRAFANELRKDQTFTLVDNVRHSETWYSPYNISWLKRIKITIFAADVGSDLVDQDVYVDLSTLPSSFFSDINSDGSDIIVADGTSETKLLRLLENLNIGAMTGDLYFTASFISSTVDTEFYIYYADSSAEETNDGTKVSPFTTITTGAATDFDASCYTFNYATYEFEGRIVDANPNMDVNSNRSRYSLSIAAPNPFFSELPTISQTLSIIEDGIIFPIIFPVVFGGGESSIAVTNNGNADAYPTIILTGGFNDLTIINENLTSNNRFLYTQPLVSGDTITITPIPSDPIKIRASDGSSLIQNTNSNFDILKLTPGVNSFSFFTSGGIDGNTSAQFTFNNTYIGI